MKPQISIRLFAAAAFAGAALFSSCVPSTSPDNTVITLNASPRTLNLTTPRDSAATNVTLSCGCTFAFKIISYVGDTTMIRYSYSPGNLDSVITPHTIFFKAAAGATKGTYRTKMIIYNHDDHGYDLYDTITTNLTLP